MKGHASRPGPGLSDGGILTDAPAGSYTPFFLARGGLRCLDGTADGFLGYSSRDMFWKDALGLVHKEDLPVATAMISGVKENPGTSGRAELRLRDASGRWRRVEAVVENVLEAPGDTGIVVAGLHA